MQSQLLRKDYKYTWANDSLRTAIICFKWDEETRLYKFVRCDYFGVSETYTVDDWAFLKDLATEVLSLCERGEV
jgi:hypothetical protein